MKAEKEPKPKILEKAKKTKPAEIKKVTGYGPVSAVFVTVGIFLFSQILVGLVVGIYVAVKRLSKQEIVDLLENSIANQFLIYLSVAVLTLLILAWFLKARQIKLSQLGLKKPNLDNLLMAVPVFIVYLVVMFIVIKLLSSSVPGINVDQEQQIGFDAATGFVQLSLVFASIVILPAIVEEILVRGFLYSGLLKAFSKYKSALLASAIFGFAHLQLGGGASPLWIVGIDTFVLSMFLIWLREKTGNIYAGMLVHGMKNSLAFLFIFVLHTA